MATDPTTTEQEQGEWVLVHDDCVSMYSPTADAKLVYLRKGEGFNQAMVLGPSRVLLVSAYPGVVEALEEAEKNLDKVELVLVDLGFTARPLLKQIRDVLSLVHPSPQGDKE